MRFRKCKDGSYKCGPIVIAPLVTGDLGAQRVWCVAVGRFLLENEFLTVKEAKEFARQWVRETLPELRKVKL